MVWWSWGVDASYAGRTGYVTGGPNPPLLDAQLTSFPAGVDITNLACSEDAGAACSSTGAVYVWGAASAAFGGATPPTSGVVNPPTILSYPEATNAVEVAQITDEATFWRRTDGTVWGVGYNRQGTFGTGEPADTYHGTPIQLTGLPAGIVRIYAVGDGYGLYAIDGSGRLWYAGISDWGQDGTGSIGGNILSHTLVSGIGQPVLDVVSGSSGPNNYYSYTNHTQIALLADHTCIWWGASPFVRTRTPSVPQVLTGIANIQQIYATNGSSTFYFLTNTGTILGFGSDFEGALCNGTWSGAPYTSTYTQVDHNALPPVTIPLKSAAWIASTTVRLPAGTGIAATPGTDVTQALLSAAWLQPWTSGNCGWTQQINHSALPAYTGYTVEATIDALPAAPTSHQVYGGFSNCSFGLRGSYNSIHFDANTGSTHTAYTETSTTGAIAQSQVFSIFNEDIVDHTITVKFTLWGGNAVVQKLAHGSMATYAMFAVTSDGGVWGWGLNDYMWGNSDPTTGGAGSSVAISPPYQDMPLVFGPTAVFRSTSNIWPYVKIVFSGVTGPFVLDFLGVTNNPNAAVPDVYYEQNRTINAGTTTLGPYAVGAAGYQYWMMTFHSAAGATWSSMPVYGGFGPSTVTTFTFDWGSFGPSQPGLEYGPYQFQPTFNSQGHQAVDVAIMAEYAIFVREGAPAPSPVAAGYNQVSIVG